MSYRVFDIKVTKVDVRANKLVIKRKKTKEGKVKYLKTVFIVDNCTLITSKDNRTVMLGGVLNLVENREAG